MLDRIKHGAIAGVVSGLAVAIGVFVFDLFARHPLATPRLLGHTLMGAPVEGTGGGGLDWLARMLVAGWELVAYSAVHFFAFALFGIAGAWVFAPGRMVANVLTGALFGLVAGSAMFYAGLLAVGPAFVAVPDWRLVIAMNAFAGIVLVSELADSPDPRAG